MVRASRSDSPPKYIWADIKKQVAGPWFSEYPELELITLRKTSEISFVASDGTELSGYLTMPDPASRERPPVVVYAHDGPQQRASRDFDPMVQLFANRGIAILQVNHRGSAGFGIEFQEAGYRQWGERMQQDIYDGLDWLASQDIVDTDRTCVVGNGYGGFVALSASYAEVRKFRCAISVNGITDLRKHMLETPFYGYAWYRNILSLGDPEDRQEIERLDRLSPIASVNRTRVPILLIHSEFDKEVAFEQYTDFRSKSRRAPAQNRFEFMDLDEGTHGLHNKANRIRTFEAADRFLRRHLN
jgi:dipeptidyl aminopeptidase/acylaminoacyl peptidase